MTVLILQARLDSVRLPRKCLLPLGGRPLLFRAMEVLATVNCDIKVLACPDDCVEPFGPLAKEAGFETVSGPKDDVLARYCNVIRKFSADRIIRATGDNPFVFSDAAEFLNQEACGLGADYSGYTGLPYGAGVESVNAAALLRAEREAASVYERENVCPYLYGHPELFRLHRPMAPLNWQGFDMRVTVDTQEDYQRAQKLFEAVKDYPPKERGRGEVIIEMYKKLESRN
ncbi:MAG: NTP transferase domain-containing protein [Treponema sp.]|nr:NTP transferase domain-containing protein [Treponema sp.]